MLEKHIIISIGRENEFCIIWGVERMLNNVYLIKNSISAVSISAMQKHLKYHSTHEKEYLISACLFPLESFPGPSVISQ
jgi:hypothetical protein